VYTCYAGVEAVILLFIDEFYVFEFGIFLVEIKSPPMTEHSQIQGYLPQYKNKTISKKSTTRNTKLNNKKCDDHNQKELHIQKHRSQQQKMRQQPTSQLKVYICDKPHLHYIFPKQPEVK
jgi:hypothetical protein